MSITVKQLSLESVFERPQRLQIPDVWWQLVQCCWSGHSKGSSPEVCWCWDDDEVTPRGRSQSASATDQRHRLTGLKTHLFNQAYYYILWELFVLKVYCTYLLTYLLWGGAGPKIEWVGAEWERSSERGYRKRCEPWAEISTAPAPLTCSGRIA